ncbi:hypothetical protein BsWGS_05692 [Bradybaena similaris]
MANTCPKVDTEEDGFSPLTIPLSVHQRYYKDSEMEHHYPNLYDFRRAAMMNSPQPLFAPYNRPYQAPKSMPPYLMFEDYRRKSDPLSKWGEYRVMHAFTNPALEKLPRY